MSPLHHSENQKLKGKIDISELNVPPEKHEYETAKYFANRGFNVKFIGSRHIKGMNNPDFMMGGKIWETKSPISDNLSSIKRRLTQATKQSEHIIFDLRRIKTKYELKIIEQLEKGCRSPSVRTLLVITKNGQLLTLKGTFSIMKAR